MNHNIKLNKVNNKFYLINIKNNMCWMIVIKLFPKEEDIQHMVKYMEKSHLKKKRTKI